MKNENQPLVTVQFYLGRYDLYVGQYIHPNIHHKIERKILPKIERIQKILSKIVGKQADSSCEY